MDRNRLARDLASFHNAPEIEVVDALTAALDRGEPDQLRRFGIALPTNIDRVDAWKLIVEQTRDAHGDFDRTLNADITAVGPAPQPDNPAEPEPPARPGRFRRPEPTPPAPPADTPTGDTGPADPEVQP